MSDHPANQPGGDQDDDGSSEPDTQVEPAQAGSTYKVLGETADADATGVVGRATDTSTTTYGVYGETLSEINGGSGVRGDATATIGRNYGVHGTAQTSDFGGAAVFGESDSTHGVRGTTNGQGYNGVFGHATSTTGISYGVRGDTDSSDSLAGGVRGWANSTSGTGAGVWGVTFSASDGAAGVRGEATASTGQTYGLHGVTDSDSINAFAVFADAAGTNADALRADATGGDNGDAVHGITDNNSYWGIWGENQATAGSQAYGVYAETASPDAAALYAAGSGGGAIEANGSMSISQRGVRAHLGTSQSVSSGTSAVVAFDTLDHDDFGGGFDTSSGEYDVQRAGDYHVETNVAWTGSLPGQSNHDIAIRVNGSNEAYRLQEVAGPSSETSLVADHLSTTLFDLGVGDTIDVEVHQDSGSTQSIWNTYSETYVAIEKVG